MSIVDFYSLIQINLFISFTSFSFYLALMSNKYVSIEKKNCLQEDLLVARDQLPNKMPVTSLPAFTCSKLTIETVEQGVK